MSTLSYEDFTLQGLYDRNVKEIPTASYETLFNNASLNTIDEFIYVDLKYDHTFTNQLNLQARLSYDRYRYTGDYPYDYSEDDTPFIVNNKDLSVGQSWRAELQAMQLLWNDHRITVGGEFQHNYEQFQTNYDLETYVKSDESSYRWAAFFQDEYSITESLTLNAGVRFDYFSTFGETVNPRVALIYTPWTSTAFKLLYGTAFRAPNEYELNYHDNGNSTIPSENLQPEELETFEFIVEHYFNQQIRAELNFFHTETNDIIAITTTADDLLQNRNTGDVKSIGAEIQLEGTWTNGYQGRISYSWQKTTRKSTDERLTNSPEHMVKLNLIAPLWSDKVFAGFETQYMSGRKTPSGGHVGDHVISNLTLFSQNWVKGLELSAGVYNLFDEEYFDPGSEEHTQNGIEQDGITFRIKAGMNF
jgi:iron complex outermembrane receptor protein